MVYGGAAEVRLGRVRGTKSYSVERLRDASATHTFSFFWKLLRVVPNGWKPARERARRHVRGWPASSLSLSLPLSPPPLFPFPLPFVSVGERVTTSTTTLRRQGSNLKPTPCMHTFFPMTRSNQKENLLLHSHRPSCACVRVICGSQRTLTAVCVPYRL